VGGVVTQPCGKAILSKLFYLWQGREAGGDFGEATVGRRGLIRTTKRSHRRAVARGARPTICVNLPDFCINTDLPGGASFVPLFKQKN